MNCKLVGRWRIVEADIWDHPYLDLCGPATILIRANGRGEISFGVLQAGLDIEYSRDSVGFTWEGFDEMDEVSGDGSAELLDDGSIEIEFALSQRRRSRSQSQEGYFFNSLLGHCLSFARCLARQPVRFEALVVFLKFWFGLAVRYRLPRCRRMEGPSLSLLRELIQSRFSFSHRFVLTPVLNQARRIVCC